MKKFLAGICFASYTMAAQGAEPPKGSSSGAKAGTVITSDGPLEADYNQKTAIFKQNVVMTDTQGTVKADTMKVFFNKESNEIERMDCQGHVRIEQKERHSESDKAVYWAAQRKVVLTGNPLIKQGEDVYQAETITIFTAENRVLFEPSAQLLIYPDKKDEHKMDLFARDSDQKVAKESR